MFGDSMIQEMGYREALGKNKMFRVVDCASSCGNTGVTLANHPNIPSGHFRGLEGALGSG